MKNTKRGFTIVELVIVIAVIAILAAILIPVFANVTTSATETARNADIKNTHAAYVAAQAEAGKAYLEISGYVFKNTTDNTYWTMGNNGKAVSAQAAAASGTALHTAGEWELYAKA